MKVIRYLVHKIYILPDGFEVYFRVGESHVKIFMLRWEQGEGSSKKTQAASDPIRTDADKKNALPDSTSGNASQILRHFGSHTCISGGCGPKLVEHPDTRKMSLRHSNSVSLGRKYSVQWKRLTIDVAELASKRYIEGWKVRDLCAHFNSCRDTVVCAYQQIRRRKFQHKSISPELQAKLLKAVVNCERRKK